MRINLRATPRFCPAGIIPAFPTSAKNTLSGAHPDHQNEPTSALRQPPPFMNSPSASQPEKNFYRIFSRPGSPLLRGVAGLVFLGAAAYLLIFVFLALVRAFYLFELEWIEGAFVDEAAWIASGLFPYPPPSLNYIPTSKMPLFFYLSAALMKLLGPGFLAPRLLSLSAVIGTFIVLYDLVSHTTHQRLAGLAAAGIYASTFRFSGAWMDLAKTDSLFLFLLLLGFWTAQRFTRGWMLALSGVFYTLAFFTKQLALPVILALAATSLVTSRGRTWPQWLSAGVLGLGLYLSFELQSSGWFSFYMFGTSLEHAWAQDLLLFWRTLLRSLWPATLLALVYAWTVLRAEHRLGWRFSQPAWLYLALGVTLVASSWGISLKAWTYDNGFMPACLGLAILAGLGFGELRRAGENPAAQTAGLWFSSLISALLLIGQFWLLAYNPLAQLPTDQTRREAQAFVDRVRALPGEVWIFNHGYFSSLAGKQSYLHSSPLSDIINAADLPPRNAWRVDQTRQMFQDAMQDQQVPWIIGNDPSPKMWMPYYLVVEDLPYEFYPLTGGYTRPRILLAANPVVFGGAFPLADPLFERYFSGSWLAPQDGSRTVQTGRAELSIGLQAGFDYELQLVLSADCSNRVQQTAALSLGWNNKVLAEKITANCSPATTSYTIPKNVINQGMNDFWLEINQGSGILQALHLQQLTHP
jgi:hypothetical protein